MTQPQSGRITGRAIKHRQYPIRNPHMIKVSVVIPVVNERKTIARIIQQAFRVHPHTEVIVVANGSTDGTKQLARGMGARVISYASPLGHDVGRSIGARESSGEIILFLDGDFVVSAQKLIPLVNAVANGTDVALNHYSGPVNKQNVHGVVLAKHALNIALSRSDLKGASMTTIPHALNRKALVLIGAENLAVPPKAHAIAVQSGLNVRTVHEIDVGRPNPRRRRFRGRDPLEKLIIGDHLEAVDWFVSVTNARGNHPDLTRNRGNVR